MKPLAVLTFCFWALAPLLGQAQNNDSASIKIKKMDDALSAYASCLAERLKNNAPKTSEPQPLADAALKECRSERQSLISAHSKIAGDPETFSSEIVDAMERKFFSERIPNYKIASNNAPSATERSEKINMNYYVCIHESYNQGVRSSVDRATLAKEVEKNCKPQRDAAYTNAVQMGASIDQALKNTRDFTDQIFVAAELNHTDMIGNHIKLITLYRGISEFCDDAIKEKTLAREEDYLSRLANLDVRFSDKGTLSRIARLYYDRSIKGMVGEYGAKKFCLFAKETLGDMGTKVSDYFRQ